MHTGAVKKVLVAPDSFKGCLMAWDVAAAIAAGVRKALPGAAVVQLPLGDGGEGTARAIAHAVTGSRLVPVQVRDPLGRPVEASFALLPGGRAVVEMAAASGLGLIAVSERAPLRTDSYGTGELVRAALDHLHPHPAADAGSPDGSAGGRPYLFLGVGGSATVDGGLGMLAALGAVFTGRGGAPIQTFGGGSLADVEGIDLSRLDGRLARTGIVLASDVSNPLLGPEGAAAVFGPQKGATPAQVRQLDAGLAHFSRVMEQQTGLRLTGFPGGGAAGGVGAAAVAVLGAAFRPGIELALELTGFASHLAGAELVITGEGRFDGQTLRGKAAFGVAAAAAKAGVPVCILAGQIAAGAEWRLPGRAVAFSIAEGPLSLAQSHRQAAALLERAARRAAYLFASGALSGAGNMDSDHD